MRNKRQRSILNMVVFDPDEPAQRIIQDIDDPKYWNIRARELLELHRTT